MPVTLRAASPDFPPSSSPTSVASSSWSRRKKLPGCFCVVHRILWVPQVSTLAPHLRAPHAQSHERPVPRPGLGRDPDRGVARFQRRRRKLDLTVVCGWLRPTQEGL